MAFIRKIRPVMDGLGSVFKHHNIEKQIQKQLKETLIELESQVLFVNSDGWKKIKEKYEVIITGLEDNILYYSQNTKKNIEKIQQNNNMLRAMREVINITDEIVSNFSMNQQQLEGETKKTEPVTTG